MSNSFSIVPAAPEAPSSDGGSSFQQNPRRQQRSAPESAPQGAPHSSQRLVIQEDGETGELTYTVIDRTTGEVVAKASRDEVSHMGQKADYAAGALIRAEA